MSDGEDPDFAYPNSASPEANLDDLAVSALTNQADLDRLMASGHLELAPAGVLSRMTDWNGMTPKEEEDARLLNSRRQAVAEYEREMSEVRQQADRLMARLDEQELEGRKKLAEADARAIVLHDGRRVLVDDKNDEYIDEASGLRLSGTDKAEAQRLSKPDSETETEQRALRDRLEQIDEAREHARKARDLSQTDSGNLSPNQMKEQEAQAREEQAIAEAKAKGIPDLDAGTDTDIAAALGLNSPQSGRTTSFAGAMGEKDTRAVALQSQFAGSAQPTNVAIAKPTEAAPSANPVRQAQFGQ
jgi:hypothetical protein